MKPSDADAKIKFNECSKIVKRQAFEKAIACDEVKKIISESIHLETMSKLKSSHIVALVSLPGLWTGADEP